MSKILQKPIERTIIGIDEVDEWTNLPYNHCKTPYNMIVELRNLVSKDEKVEHVLDMLRSCCNFGKSFPRKLELLFIINRVKEYYDYSDKISYDIKGIPCNNHSNNEEAFPLFREIISLDQLNELDQYIDNLYSNCDKLIEYCQSSQDDLLIDWSNAYKRACMRVNDFSYKDKNYCKLLLPRSILIYNEDSTYRLYILENDGMLIHFRRVITEEEAKSFVSHLLSKNLLFVNGNSRVLTSYDIN